MNKTRLETLSDGVMAIVMTVMVLELKAPEGASLGALKPVYPQLLAYVLSFMYVGIYWNNHHHMLHASEHVNGRVLWANLHLLFWLTLIPFVTLWVGLDHDAPVPTAVYAGLLLLAAIAYTVLTKTLIAANGGKEFRVARARGGAGPEGIRVARVLRGGHRAGVREGVDGAGGLRGGRAGVARPGQEIERVITKKEE